MQIATSSLATAACQMPIANCQTPFAKSSLSTADCQTLNLLDSREAAQE
jgi:hypothetical protein